MAVACKTVEDKVSADNQQVNKLTVMLLADKQAIEKLANEVVPTKQEMYIAGSIHAGDTFAGMVGSNGFVGGPFR